MRKQRRQPTRIDHTFTAAPIRLVNRRLDPLAMERPMHESIERDDATVMLSAPIAETMDLVFLELGRCTSRQA